MKRIRLSMYLVATACGLMMGCKKEKTAEPACTTSMAGMAGTYRLTALQYKINAAAPAQDYLQLLDDCEQDDLVTLQANGSYIYQDAGVSCTPARNETGTWSLSGSTISSDGIINGTISSYNCSTLVYHLDNILLPGDSYIFTMQKQ
jgi:Lipocalin-like domain